MELEEKQEVSVDENKKEQASNPKEETTEKTFTQSELDEIVQREKARAKRNAEKELKIRQEEAEKLRQMNEAQKAEYETKKRDDYIAELEAKINRSELEKEASKMLAEAHIEANESVLSFVVKENAEDTKEAINSFSKIIDSLADKRVSDMLKGKTPTRSESTHATGVTKEEFNRMGYSSRNELLQSNPELYRQLKG